MLSTSAPWTSPCFRVPDASEMTPYAASCCGVNADRAGAGVTWVGVTGAGGAWAGVIWEGDLCGRDLGRGRISCEHSGRRGDRRGGGVQLRRDNLLGIYAGDLLRDCRGNVGDQSDRATQQSTDQQGSAIAQGLGDHVTGHRPVDCADDRQILQRVQGREDVMKIEPVFIDGRRLSGGGGRVATGDLDN